MSFSNAVAIKEEKIKGKGEDEVLLLIRDKAALIASFDGCGGSGGKVYPKADGWSGARIGSGCAAETAAKWFDREVNSKSKTSAGTIARELEICFEEQFRRLKEELDDGRAPISKMSSSFPTTMAATFCQERGKSQVRCVFLWAGDSRAYLFRPSGLQQMSRDNVKGATDPFDSLRLDGILNNVISADKSPSIHWREEVVKEPCMVICATDGCFSYFRSPILFEGIILETLEEAGNMKTWENSLREAVGTVASDDYSMQILLVGFESFEAVKAAYSHRLEEYREKYIAPLNEILSARDVEGHRELWLEYKKGYMPD